jgi:hypothetical protein
VFNFAGPPDDDDPFPIAFRVTLSLLVLLVVLVLIVVLVMVMAVCLMKCRKQTPLEKTINTLNSAKVHTFGNTTICCCGKQDNRGAFSSDGPNTKSKNGFTQKSAYKLVRALVDTIIFGESDSKIMVELEKANISSRGVTAAYLPESSGLRQLSQSPTPLRIGRAETSLPGDSNPTSESVV